MKSFLLSLLLLTVLVSSLQAQVKIGDNPGTINANSMLELESTNKGFLPPRVAINNENSVLPLTGTVPAGMFVYSVGGAVPDGQYVWNGVKWLAMSTSVMMRDSMVIVKSQADFPAPVAGVINLLPGILYEVNGTVAMTSKINLNGCTIRGADRSSDKLIYTPTSGELFTGSFGGVLSNMVISATGTGGKLFNLDAGGSLTKAVVLESIYILNCADVGRIKGFAGFVAFTDVAFSGNLNGIIFEDLGDLLILNGFWIADNHNTYEKYVGAFGTIQKQGGRMTMLSVFSAVGMDITGITSLGGGSMKNNLFSGTGTFITGSFSNKWEVESYGLNTEKDDEASGNLYVTATAITTFAAANTPVKALGTTTAVGLFRVTSPANNRLTYTGAKNKRCIVHGAISFTSAGNNKLYSFYVAKNGIILPESKMTRKINTGSDQGVVPLSCTVVLSPNDYIEIWVENNTDNVSLTVETMNLLID